MDALNIYFVINVMMFNLFVFGIVRTCTLIEHRKFKLQILWFDLWVGAFIDKEKRKVYLAPVIGIIISFNY